MQNDPDPKKDERQFWWCGSGEGCGHVVGEIGYKDLQQGKRVKVLLVYEVSQEMPPVELPTLRGQIPSGFGMRCTLCSNTWDWYLSKVSLERLLLNFQVRNG